jgi:hypothetical protein
VPRAAKHPVPVQLSRQEMKMLASLVRRTPSSMLAIANLDIADAPWDQPPQIAQPRPVRPSQHPPTVLQASSTRTSSTQSNKDRPTPPPRPRSPQQLACSDEEEEKREEKKRANATRRRKRHNSEADAKDQDIDKNLRERFDSTWKRKGDRDRKGSGAGGALSN